MPEYLTPGVYVEEVPAAIKPIAAVGTSTAGFIGLVADDVETPLRPGHIGFKTVVGADNKPKQERVDTDFYPVADAGTTVLVDSWDSFRTHFGDVQPGNTVLANAVYGFFNNGGSRAWVIRVAGPATDAGTGTPAAPATETDGSTKTDGSTDTTVGDPPAEGTDTTATDTTATDGTGTEAGEDVEPVGVDTDPAVQAALISALDAFLDVDEISIVAIPGAISDDVQKAIVDHCENENTQDRFAVLDGRRGVTELTKTDIAGNVRDSSYAAVYFPWIAIGTDAVGKPIYQPPSGHVAGVYARVDTSRGVHKAPANEVIRGANGVETTVGKAAQAGLNPDGVNVIRMFGPNVTIWGARTTAAVSQPEWKYVSSRRLYIFVRESIQDGLRWAVFEPNGPDLWSRVRRNVTAFLTTVWADGALLGTTAEQAFYVRCDEDTNRVDVRNAGQLATEVGIALLNPAEFVVFRISQWAGPAA
ncbi:phage tail sheath family protein [Pseudofrankia inefficax]|uniref:Tail sheath protein n=1 Tax=Pseudofrankia inefficax (strain DSM 45817 / CECT 9037 / DDB 130130 / EuI1c) TaxID=298654 RepID=E3IXB1_PSEI1|nr:phage tail sheath subtilisin-like domain-containing protein [Pseudofrankia inefficax]ADP85011.1 tail sheath protein [Pseudofrankia inefficax]